jgi:hypothetical protein
MNKRVMSITVPVACALFLIVIPAQARRLTAISTPTADEIMSVNAIFLGPDAQEAVTQPEYKVGRTDFDLDGQPDLIVHFSNPDSCRPTGCKATLLLTGPEGLEVLPIKLPDFAKALEALPTSQHGMPDLKVDKLSNVFRWDGKAYR